MWLLWLPWSSNSPAFFNDLSWVFLLKHFEDSSQKDNISPGISSFSIQMSKVLESLHGEINYYRVAHYYLNDCWHCFKATYSINQPECDIGHCQRTLLSTYPCNIAVNGCIAAFKVLIGAKQVTCDEQQPSNQCFLSVLDAFWVGSQHHYK